MRFLTSHLLDCYVGEELLHSVSWHYGYGPVIYLSPDERELFRVHIVDGLMVDSAGRALNTGGADGSGWRPGCLCGRVGSGGRCPDLFG